MEHDTGDAIPRLNNLFMQFPRVQAEWVRLAAIRVMELGQRNARAQLNRRPLGALSRSITMNMLGPAQAEVGPGVVYGAIHEFGGIIRPVRARALVFEIGGQTIFASSVRMPKRPYMAPALEEASGDFGDMGAQLIDEAAS